MKSYIDDIVVTDSNGEKAILYPRTKQEAVEGLGERLENVEKPDITETTETTMPNSCEGRLLFKEIVGKTEELTSTGVNVAEEIVVFDSSAQWDSIFLLKADLKPSTQYTISFIGTVGNKYYPNEKVFEQAPSFVVEKGINTVSVTTRADVNSQKNGDGFYAILKNSIVQPNANKFENFMMNLGSVALPYEPYGVGTPFIRSVEINKIKTHDDNGNESSITFSEPIELNKIGDLQDVYVDGKLTKRLVKVVFDGTEAFEVISGSTGGGYEYRMKLKIQAKNSSHNTCANAICNVAKVNDAVFSWNNNVEMFAITNSVFYLRQPSWTDVTNVDTLKAKLKSLFDSGNPVHAVYEIATPITALPVADQVALNSVKTFDGTTYLEFDSPLQPTFVAEYGTSKVGGKTLEALAIARNNDIRISSVEASVVNNI